MSIMKIYLLYLKMLRVKKNNLLLLSSRQRKHTAFLIILKTYGLFDTVQTYGLFNNIHKFSYLENELLIF